MEEAEPQKDCGQKIGMIYGCNIAQFTDIHMLWAWNIYAVYYTNFV